MRRRRRPSGSGVEAGRFGWLHAEAALDLERGVELSRLRRGERDLLEASREDCRGCGDPLPPQALRRRLRQLLPALAAAPLDLCASCAAGAPCPTSAGASTGLEHVTP